MPKIFSTSPLYILISLVMISVSLLTGCGQTTDKNTDKSTQPVSMHIAAAANLSQVLPQLITAFNQQNPTFTQKIEVSYASSGKLYTQITQNAPYDIFLAANQEFPTKLVESHAGKYGKPFTYTQGQLALYSTTKPLDKTAESTIQHYFPSNLDKNSPIKLAIANPELAPYGKSAQHWLDNQQLTTKVKDHLVMGDNIEQAFTFVNTGNADFGLVAVSQLVGDPNPIPSSHYVILPASRYPAIKQDGLLLQPSPTSEAFIRFLLSPQAQAILVKSGYLPIS